jgi:hypothetical protein
MAFGVNLGPLDSRTDYRLHGGAQQPVLGREVKGLWLPDGGVHDRQALLRRRQTDPTVLLTH